MKMSSAYSVSGHLAVRKIPIVTQIQLSVEMVKDSTNMVEGSNWRITTTGMMIWSFVTIEISVENSEFQVRVGVQTEAK